MKQDIIREDLKSYLKENGIKAKFIAEKIGISPAMISYFINHKKKLSSASLILISNIIYN
ncbi:helix-turn-helix domain-containing protein [Clostridium beijerinckii]|jgi:Helix-turn-helix.|uniref:Helix-turn-helix transcriptional regulator n=1 Tax=Clostridium beijerinckii TaxID=1520 RepID=A0AAE2RXB9_CLOBE|nr:helix-turn-helix transcriptional regulator [Clostridium beijerinckii]MBF7811949.1 helix-turn-helix transcriptional regulator [Clostridium beijerinckii]NRT25200.1 plasmid maintenance system antidote protein VapI [Clostridium beijerinckii]NRT67206.1 plasmid maintenance system antidote protein VapI [Clostridium beijerinckii]NRT81295.1 plasmid maintenance system antidote protein VapI [Clostridium beijerinckii]NRU52015.1 plasmid maintenance system antidote protein VapI [Clostridium beijerinckii]